MLSARLDAELTPDDETVLTRHLGDCDSCRQFEHDALELRRAMRLHAAAELAHVDTADLDRRSLPGLAAAPAGSLRIASILRAMVFVVGGTLIVLNIVNVIDVDAADRHLSRHNGVFGAALGIGMLTVAAKPHRAIGLVPITSAITILMVAVAVGDLASGRVSILGEAIHLLEFAGLVCLWVISGGIDRLHRRTGKALQGLWRPTVSEWPPA